MKKIAIITAITNNYNRLRDFNINDNVECLAFLDEETENNHVYSKMWNVMPATNLFNDPNRNAKIYKILSHKFTDAEYIIWIDGNITLKVDHEVIIKDWMDDTDIAVFKHPFRDCVYDEGIEVIKCGKDTNNTVINHLDRYRKLNYKDHNGLAECGVIVSRRTKEVNRLFDQWWSEICCGSRRDQISFPYVFNGKYKAIDGNVRDHKYFNYYKHGV